MRRIAALAVATALMTAFGPNTVQAQNPQTDSAMEARVEAAIRAAPDVATMDWAQVTGGALTEAPYSVYPGAKFGMAANAGDIYMVSMMTPDGGAKVDAFYRKEMAGWTRRELPAGGIAFVKGDQAEAQGFAAIIQGPGVMIEPRESSPRPYTLITFQTPAKQQ